jgi:hypothetical protein
LTRLVLRLWIFDCHSFEAEKENIPMKKATKKQELQDLA